MREAATPCEHGPCTVARADLKASIGPGQLGFGPGCHCALGLRVAYVNSSFSHFSYGLF
jgi:hypothetical protein